VVTDSDGAPHRGLAVGDLDPRGSGRNWLIAQSEAPLAVCAGG